MKVIELTKGRVAIVDDEDFEGIAQWRWRIAGKGYAVRSTNRGGEARSFYMHRQIMNCPDGMTVDHINGDTLDNRRSNLRICTQGENLRSSRLSDRNKCRIKGVYQCGRTKRFCAQIALNGKRTYIGTFSTPEEAGAAYTEASKSIHGEFSVFHSRS